MQPRASISSFSQMRIDRTRLLGVFARFLPDLKATFSIFDQPQIYLSWARRGSLVELGLRGEHTTHLQETDSAHVRLSRSCPPDSHFRNNSASYEGELVTRMNGLTEGLGKSFIFDSLEAGNPCESEGPVRLRTHTDVH